MTIQQLREDYKELIGKRPFNGWGEEKLEEKMDEFKKENNINEVVVSQPRPAALEEKTDEIKSIEFHSSRHEANEKLRRAKVFKQLFNLEPIFIREKPYAIIDNEYVEWEKAELIGLKKIKAEIEQLIKEKTAVFNT